jgi:hypothetical protein
VLLRPTAVVSSLMIGGNCLLVLLVVFDVGTDVFSPLDAELDWPVADSIAAVDNVYVWKYVVTYNIVYFVRAIRYCLHRHYKKLHVHIVQLTFM